MISNKNNQTCFKTEDLACNSCVGKCMVWQFVNMVFEQMFDFSRL